jgi:hypothetical protein
MKPVTYDFDVITDAPAPKSRPPQQAERAPQARAHQERRSVAPPAQKPREQIQAAE